MNPSTLFKKNYKIMNIVTAVLVALLLLCFVFSFDAESGYLANGILTTVFFITYGIGAVVAFSAIFIPSEFETIITLNEITGKSRSRYTASGISIILAGVLNLFLTKNIAQSKSELLSALGLVAFGLYVILLLTKNGYEFSLVKSVLLFVSIAFPTMIALANNQNYNYHINSIENYLSVLFACSFLAYILQTIKRLCYNKHSNWHFATMLLTYMSGLSLSGAYVIAFLFNSVNEDNRFCQMIMILTVSIFVGIELNHFIEELDSK